MDAPSPRTAGIRAPRWPSLLSPTCSTAEIMKFDPADPHWSDRDRFILSAGHASILQYSLLMLSGLGLELDDLRALPVTRFVDPGPSGDRPHARGRGDHRTARARVRQRRRNGSRRAPSRERFGIGAVSHHTWVIAGDGCLMEGVSHEAASLAGHLGLDRLICVFDDNRITIDGGTALACDDDVSARFGAYGWRVIELGDIGEDLDALEAALHTGPRRRRTSDTARAANPYRVPVSRSHRQPRRSRTGLWRRGRRTHQSGARYPRRAVPRSRRPR